MAPEWINIRALTWIAIRALLTTPSRGSSKAQQSSSAGVRMLTLQAGARAARGVVCGGCSPPRSSMVRGYLQSNCDQSRARQDGARDRGGVAQRPLRGEFRRLTRIRRGLSSSSLSPQPADGQSGDWCQRWSCADVSDYKSSRPRKGSFSACSRRCAGGHGGPATQARGAVPRDNWHRIGSRRGAVVPVVSSCPSTRRSHRSSRRRCGAPRR